MLIRAFKIDIRCSEKKFGFQETFNKGLNIIRGSNSSGKSTLVNCMLYSLGMEELVGGKNDGALQYAVRNRVEFEGETFLITESSVSIEIENREGEIATITRSIRSEHFNPKLARVVEGPALTRNYTGPITYKFIHDGYSAVSTDGFFKFLEEFLKLNLPEVYDSSGKRVKLYLQAVFAAFAVEQKRGWTDYIANIPFYSVKDARIKVVEFLLGTQVFEQQALRSELDFESEKLNSDWNNLHKKVSIEARELGLKLEGLSSKIDAELDPANIGVEKLVEGKKYKLTEIVASLHRRHADLEKKANGTPEDANKNAIADIEAKTREINHLTANYENALSNLAIHKATLANHSQIAKQAAEELAKNQVALKLKKYGAELGLDTANDSCPTCHQHIEDSLSSLNDPGSKMDIETNIRYLDSQAKMLSRQEAGIKIKIEESELSVKDYSSRLERARSLLAALRSDVTKGATVSRALLKQQLFVEVELEKIEKFNGKLDYFIEGFTALAASLKDNQKRRKGLGSEHYSSDDLFKIDLFFKLFRSNAGSFDYQSAPIKDIEFDRHTLLPYLAKIELREILDTSAEKKEKEQAPKDGDMAQNSSASDFVRLIWSYIIALYQASAHNLVKGNHPGIIIFDEPGQHSMATKSQLALFKMLSAESSLQAIVAASFDDSDAAFKESTSGVPFKYIRLGDKCISPID
ncbi:hypothetical protein FEM01_14005 [Pseudomonas mosselii]|uniref:Rad50/SbcC-type AAA domain-containing protein n=2 Tax=Pseudomonas mosselii TaxID=78327 RepID=A0A5R8Z1M3_9PSED|nr:hypothetical protein FEM01_14005 [Pseudomonas mosselii]